MKADRCGRTIVGAVVLALLLCGAEQARATNITIVDFEDLGVAYGTRLDIVPPPAGIGVVSRGFFYNPDPANGISFNDLHISNQYSWDSFNGTTVGIAHNEVILTEEYGRTFSLQSFDFAGFLTDKEVRFKVTGVLEDYSTITQYFTPDGKVDGNAVPVVADFQTFYPVGNWTNLISVRWTHTGYGTVTGLFALDNIVVAKSQAIPEPSTITLLGLGTFFLLGQGWFARKRLKALARMT